MDGKDETARADQTDPARTRPPRTDPAQADRAEADQAQADQAQARRAQEARTRLLALGADELGPRAWRPAPVPPSAVDLVQLAVWRSPGLAPDDVLRALTLLPDARAEVEGLEAGLLFIARSAGLTWAQIAEAMGFNSPQACQQHFTRLTTRRGGDR